MAGSGIAVRCPSCGTDLRAFAAPFPPTQWFPCPHCRTVIPVVVPRDPPPLYTWEVLPGLYPPLEPPRPPRWRLGPAVAVALAAVAVVSVVLAGALVFYGVQASGPASYTISGVVLKDVGGQGFAAAGAQVVLTDDAGARSTQTVGVDGRFSFTGVPSGGVSLNVTLAGYGPTTLLTFVSPGYDAGSTGLTVVLYPGGPGAGTTVSLTPFSDLESFLASVYGGAALLGIAAIVAGFAALTSWPPTRRTGGVVGGSAGVAVPVVVYLLGLFPPFPLVAESTGVVAGLGAFAVAISAAELYRSGAPTRSA